MHCGSLRLDLGHGFCQKGQPNLSIGGLHFVYIFHRFYHLTSHDNEREDDRFEER